MDYAFFQHSGRKRPKKQQTTFHDLLLSVLTVWRENYARTGSRFFMIAFISSTLFSATSAICPSVKPFFYIFIMISACASSLIP